MDHCLNCGGAIGEPGVPYGYAGKWCHCPVHPSRMYQNPSRNPLDCIAKWRSHPNGVDWIRANPDGTITVR